MGGRSIIATDFSGEETHFHGGPGPFLGSSRSRSTWTALRSLDRRRVSCTAVLRSSQLSRLTTSPATSPETIAAMAPAEIETIVENEHGSAFEVGAPCVDGARAGGLVEVAV